MKKRSSNFLRTIRVALLLCTGIFLILGFSITSLFMLKMDDTVYAIGKLQGGDDYSLRSLAAGNIVARLKNAGSAVTKGEAILKIDQTPLDEQMTLLNGEIKELESGISGKEKQNEFADKNLPIYKDLYHKGSMSRVEYEKLALLATTNKNEIEQLNLKLENLKKKLKIMEKHTSDYVIFAPDDGVITELSFPVGQHVQQGDIIAKMSSIRSKKYLAYIDEKYIRKISPEQKVKIISTQYNYMKYGYFEGIVLRILELPVKQQDGSNYYPIEVIVGQESYELKLGSTAELMISTGKIRILFYLMGFKN